MPPLSRSNPGTAFESFGEMALIRKTQLQGYFRQRYSIVRQQYFRFSYSSLHRPGIRSKSRRSLEASSEPGLRKSDQPREVGQACAASGLIFEVLFGDTQLPGRKTFGRTNEWSSVRGVT
jgi:hypothetical protein